MTVAVVALVVVAAAGWVLASALWRMGISLKRSNCDLQRQYDAAAASRAQAWERCEVAHTGWNDANAKLAEALKTLTDMNDQIAELNALLDELTDGDDAVLQEGRVH